MLENIEYFHYIFLFRPPPGRLACSHGWLAFNLNFFCFGFLHFRNTYSQNASIKGRPCFTLVTIGGKLKRATERSVVSISQIMFFIFFFHVFLFISDFESTSSFRPLSQNQQEAQN
jgi:hypothetical protein